MLLGGAMVEAGKVGGAIWEQAASLFWFREDYYKKTQMFSPTVVLKAAEIKQLSSPVRMRPRRHVASH